MSDILYALTIVVVLCLAYAFLGLLLSLWEDRYRTVGQRTRTRPMDDLRRYRRATGWREDEDDV